MKNMKNKHTVEIELLQNIQNSTSIKRKVKCLIVLYDNRNRILNYFSGFNQSIMGLHDFNCEIEINNKIEVNPYTIHAESMSIFNLLKDYHKHANDVKTINIYCSTAPCVECTKEIILLKGKLSSTKIFNLFYGDKKSTFDSFHEKTGLQDLIPKIVLQSVGIKTEHLPEIKISTK